MSPKLLLFQYWMQKCKTQVKCEDSVLKKVALLKQGGHFLLHFYNFWILFLTFAFSTFPPLSTNLPKKDFKVQVVHSYRYTISSLSGREHYNQHHNVHSVSLNICFTYMYFKIITLIGKRNLQTREWCNHTLPIVLCVFPIPSPLSL